LGLEIDYVHFIKKIIGKASDQVISPYEWVSSNSKTSATKYEYTLN